MTGKTALLAALAAFIPALALSADTAGSAKPGGTHVVNKGDTLWGLSGKYYGDPESWPRIYKANKEKIKDPKWIYPAMELSIPDLLLRAEEVKTTESPAPLKEEVPAELSGPAEPQAKTEPPQAAPIQASAPVKVGEPLEEPVPEKPLSAQKAPLDDAQPADAPLPAVKTPLMPKKTAKIFTPLQDAVTEPIDEMPQDPTSDNGGVAVPGNWKQDGFVLISNIRDTDAVMAQVGDVLEASVNSAAGITPGDFLVVYRKGRVSKTNGRKQLMLERVALLQTLTVHGKHVTAQVIKADADIQKNDLIKRAASGK